MTTYDLWPTVFLNWILTNINSVSKRKELKINISLARSCLNWEARIGKESFLLKFSFKKYFLNPKLNITFIPNMPTGCGNTSIIECKCPFIRHSSWKCLLEIVGHVGRVFSEASVSKFGRQYAKGKWEGSSLGDSESRPLYSSKIRW